MYTDIQSEHAQSEYPISDIGNIQYPISDMDISNIGFKNPILDISDIGYPILGMETQYSNTRYWISNMTPHIRYETGYWMSTWIQRLYRKYTRKLGFHGGGIPDVRCMQYIKHECSGNTQCSSRLDTHTSPHIGGGWPVEAQSSPANGSPAHRTIRSPSLDMQ